MIKCGRQKQQHYYNQIHSNSILQPSPCRVGSVGSVSASRTVDHEFASRPGHTKDHQINASATWPSLPKKHYDGLNLNQTILQPFITITFINYVCIIGSDSDLLFCKHNLIEVHIDNEFNDLKGLFHKKVSIIQNFFENAIKYYDAALYTSKNTYLYIKRKYISILINPFF